MKQRRLIYPLNWALLCVPLCISSAPADTPKVPSLPPARFLSSFTYADVKLLSDPLANQAKAARAFYLALSEDDLLNGFRLRAKLPAPGKPMGGWYDPEDFAGAHPFGQFISALSRMYATTNDRRFKQKVARLVHGFHQTIRQDGFFYSSDKAARDWPCYIYDKNCTGMRDAFRLTGNKEALQVLSKMTDWAFTHMPRRNDEWYTLPENLYNCYDLTHDSRYLKMAKEYDYSTPFYDKFAVGQNAFSPNLHAYSHVNTLSSAAKAFEATGDPKYFDAVEGAWNYLTSTQMIASGGWGPNERFVSAGKGNLLAAIMGTDQGFETLCGTYANVNLDRYLLGFTGNAQYGDNMERVLYNGSLASLPPQPDGHTFYYSDYRPTTQKVLRSDKWTCCSGTYAEVTADYPLNVYFHRDDQLFVNLYQSSELTWNFKSQAIHLAQSSTFPEQFESALTINLAGPAKFTLNLRIPTWCTSSPFITVNGRVPRDAKLENGFLSIVRDWKNGDTIQCTFSAKLRFEAIDSESPDTVALMYGPILLVQVGDTAKSVGRDALNAKNAFKRGPELEFVYQAENIHFRPFYRVKQEKYTTYMKL